MHNYLEITGQAVKQGLLLEDLAVHHYRSEFTDDYLGVLRYPYSKQVGKNYDFILEPLKRSLGD